MFVCVCACTKCKHPIWCGRSLACICGCIVEDAQPRWRLPTCCVRVCARECLLFTWTTTGHVHSATHDPSTHSCTLPLYASRSSSYSRAASGLAGDDGLGSCSNDWAGTRNRAHVKKNREEPSASRHARAHLDGGQHRHDIVNGAPVVLQDV